MNPLRLRSEIWVQAYLRRVQGSGAAAYVLRRGDPHAGAILICVTSAVGTGLFAPAPNLGEGGTGRTWAERISPAPDSDTVVRAHLGRETSIDPDVWIIEIEDRDGRHFLGDDLEPAGGTPPRTGRLEG